MSNENNAGNSQDFNPLQAWHEAQLAQQQHQFQNYMERQRRMEYIEEKKAEMAFMTGMFRDIVAPALNDREVRKEVAKGVGAGIKGLIETMFKGFEKLFGRREK